jgi:serine/threonine protein kinase
MGISTNRDVTVKSGYEGLLLSRPNDSMVEFACSNPGGCVSGHSAGKYMPVHRVEMTLVSGTHLGSFQILRLLGAGGMGEVYLARDKRLDRNVAIKVLPGEVTTDSVSVRRFEREAKAASALNHPNIITIYEIGEISGSHYIATEYIEGETLRQRIARHKLSVPDALDIAIQVASALSAAHHAGIIHRDIKPENVMVRPDGYAKVLDFGLVKLSEKEFVDVHSRTKTLQNTTEPGYVVGTVRYMSPEQARGKPLDARTDIFSLGILLYEMVTGCAPFQGDSMADILAAILQNEPLPLDSYLPDAPEELQRIVSIALRKDNNERYQTMSELLLDLKNLRDELQVQSKLERSPAIAATGNLAKKQTANSEATQSVVLETSPSVAARTNSSAEYLVRQIRSHKAIVIATLLMVVIGAGAFFYINRQPVLTEQDTILVADFVNTTGDSIFDGTLKQGLAVQLAQSPFLHLFPDIRVRQT